MSEAASIEAKRKALRERIRESAPLMVAFSGGVDSAYLLAAAVETVGPLCLGVIADSPSLPRQALADALELARTLGAQVEVLATVEMEDANYTSNPINRCYFCKAELFQKLEALASARGFRTIAYGENADDVHQERPGRRAAVEFQIRAPLQEVGLTKSEIRALSRELRLPTADVPAQPCLSSRIPHGTPVTHRALAMIERAEAALRGFGFAVFRVRHMVEKDRTRARLEIAPNELEMAKTLVAGIQEAMYRAGYDEVAIDPRGYRSLVV